MIKFKELKQIHLEITNNCQAKCPMCSRNDHGGIENPLIQITNWTIEDFKNIITQEVLDQVDSIYFCGNYGDPLLNQDLILMCEYIRDNSEGIMVRIHTNGSIRSESWWRSLAKALPHRHNVIFGIDGMEDTHSIYRIGTDYNKILRNASAFISAGGIAEWAFIVFEHNQHQVIQAEQTAYQYKFKRFSKKNSNRFMAEPQFPVYNKNGETEYYIKPPTETTIKFIDRNILKNYKSIVRKSVIDCMSKHSGEVYIDAFKTLYPCCFLAITPYNHWESGVEFSHILSEISQQYTELIYDFGGIQKLNTLHYSISEIIESDRYQTLWNKYWTSHKLITCARTCGVNDISKSADQFIERKQLNNG